MSLGQSHSQHRWSSAVGTRCLEPLYKWKRKIMHHKLYYIVHVPIDDQDQDQRSKIFIVTRKLRPYVVVLKREPEQEIATSSEWTQLWTPIPLFEQERRHDSLPKQPTLSSQIRPEPEPYLQKSDVGWSHVMMTIRFQNVLRQYVCIIDLKCMLGFYIHRSPHPSIFCLQ